MALSARVIANVQLASHTDGTLTANFGDEVVAVGRVSAQAAKRAQQLYLINGGLPLAAFAHQRTATQKEMHRLVRRLAAHGLLEWCFGGARDGAPDIVIEPQLADYWPRLAPLKPSDVLALSRFAYLRRRGNDLVLESPRAGAVVRICNPRILNTLALLAAPRALKELPRQDGLAVAALCALLRDCGILFTAKASDALRAAEGDPDLVLWDFHDLLFHARSMEGRHANPQGGVYAHAGAIPPLPALRPPWPGKRIDLRELTPAHSEPSSAFAQLLRARHSTRIFDDAHPITVTELARLLAMSARVQSTWRSDDFGTTVDYAARPYPSAGASYPLELYLTVNNCQGLGPGFYHYDAGTHVLVPISVRAEQREALLGHAQFAMGAPAVPQVLIAIAARFGRVAWKYSAIAYALVLKDAGVLMQTLYLAAADLGLGGCAIGIANIELFAKITGLAFHVEGPVAQFALGRPAKDER